MEHVDRFQVTAAILTVSAVGLAVLLAIRKRDWIMPVRHAVAAGSMWIFVWLFLSLRPDMEGVHAWNRAFADASIVLLATTMAIGPLSRLWRAAAKAIPWRREFGIWGTVAAVAHVSIYWDWVYDWAWRPFFYAFERVHADGGTRLVVSGELGRTAFAIGNDVGLVALVYATILAGTSNDVSVRILRRGWTWLMARATTFWLLALLHTWIFAYLVYAGTKVVAPLLWTAFAGVLALQLAGFVKTLMPSRGGDGPRRLADPRHP